MISKQMKTIRTFLIILISLIVILVLVPLLIPIQGAGTIDDPRQLAAVDSQFIELNGVTVHFLDEGQGENSPVILLHGFGSNTWTWNKVIPELAKSRRVIAYDWPGFGLTSRPLAKDWGVMNPYSTEGQVDLLINLLDRLGIQKAVLIGNSAGALIATEAALVYPDRVAGLVLVDPALNGIQFSPFVEWLMQTPQMDRIGPILARQIQTRGDEVIATAWHDPTLITDQDMQMYHLPLEIKDWDRSLWEFTKAHKADVTERINEISVPVLLITGDDDRIVPTTGTLALAAAHPSWKLIVVENSGHLPQEERPGDFLDVVTEYLDQR